MNTSAIQHMSVAEKLQAMEALWESLEPEAVPAPDWHAAELAETAARHAAGHEPAMAWEQAKALLREGR